MDKLLKKFVDLSNGERYAYLDQGQGEKIVFLLHGNMSSSLYFYDFFKRMENQKEYRLIAPDMRGFGDSSYVNRFDSFDDLAEDLNLFCASLGIKKCYLIGWSAGAGVGYRLIIKNPQLIQKFVSLNGASCRGYPLYKKDQKLQPIVGAVYLNKDELSMDPVQVLPMNKAILNKQKNFIDLIYSYTIFNVKKPGKDVLGVLFEENLKQRNLVDFDWSLANLNMSSITNLYQEGNFEINQVKCPVMLLWGTNDLVVTREMVEETSALLPQAIKKFYPNASHALLLDEPEQFKNDVLSFFENK